MLCWHSLIKSWAFNSAVPLRCDFPGHPCHSRFLPGVELLIVWGTFHRFFPPNWNQFHCHETQLHLSPMLSWQTPSPWNCHFEKTRCQLSKPFWNASEIYIPLKKQQNKTKIKLCVCCLWGREDMSCVEAHVPGWQHVPSRVCLDHWGATYVGHLGICHKPQHRRLPLYLAVPSCHMPGNHPYLHPKVKLNSIWCVMNCVPTNSYIEQWPPVSWNMTVLVV